MPKINSTPKLPNKGQKSTKSECEAFIREMEMNGNDINNNNALWEPRANGQLLRRLYNVGQGIMSFYTTKDTLLFQGKDLYTIKSTFTDWRNKRLELMIEEDEKEYQSSYSVDVDTHPKERAMKRPRVDVKTKSEPSITEDDNRKEAAYTTYDTGDCNTDYASSYGYNKQARKDADYSFGMGKQYHRSTTEEECKYCKRPISKHRSYPSLYEGKMCRYSGKYKCVCGRWWWAGALKIQSKGPEEDGAFPPHTFPGCLNCKENYDVKLIEHKSNDDSRTSVTDRGHQWHLCQLCKKGLFCPKAN